MKKLGEICSISYYALDKADVVIDEYTFSVVSKSLESVFKMVPVAAQEKNIEAQHRGGIAGEPGTANKQSVQCQHSFYAVRCANIVRCNKCEAEFPLISTC